MQQQKSTNFTLDKMTEKFGQILEPYVSRLTTQVPLNLPKLSKTSGTKVTLPKLNKGN